MRQYLHKGIVVCCIIMVVLAGCSHKQEDKKSDTTNSKTEEKQIALVENNRYVEPLHPTTEQIEAFNLLSKAVEENNELEEAKQVGVSFVYDFFMLSNKESSDDVGGLQFIPSSYIRSFMAYAKAYYYSNYGTIVNEYGKESLPQVINVNVNSIEASKISYQNMQYDGYILQASVEYQENKLNSSMLKKDIKLSIIATDDFNFNRSYDYTDKNLIIEGEKYPCFRVVSMK